MLGLIYQYFLKLAMGSVSTVSHKGEGRRWVWLLCEQLTVSQPRKEKGRKREVSMQSVSFFSAWLPLIHW